VASEIHWLFVFMEVYMNRKLIKLIFSLSITLLATISFIYGWFISNSTCEASGISVRTADVAVTNGHLERYKALHNIDNDTYSFDLENGDIDKWGNDRPLPFDSLNDYDRIIYKLSFMCNKESYAVSLSRNDLSVKGSIFKETTNGDFLNYLSNVADFYYLTTTDGNNFKIDNYSDGSSVKNLPYVSFGTSKLDEINVISGNTTIGQEVSIYLLFDYNKNNINRLWTDNVGTNVDRIFFKEDLEFRVR
jgi:hypothetical protein